MLDQPTIGSVVQRLAQEVNAQAALLLHENGQVLQRSGWVNDDQYPAIAALVAAMIATGKSLSALGDTATNRIPNRLSCDSESLGLYLVGVGPADQGLWLAVLFDQPLNPGRLRMRVRSYAEMLAKLGSSGEAPLPDWEVPQNGTAIAMTGASLAPAVALVSHLPEKITQADSSLFSNITDDEIDRLFENASS